MKRGYDDEQWQNVKDFIYRRDSGECQFLRKLTLAETFLLKKSLTNFSLLKELDPAHVFPVSLYPELCYNVENVVLLSRPFHERLDNHCSPVTGEPVTEEELASFWKRIIGEQRYNKLLTLIEKE